MGCNNSKLNANGEEVPSRIRPLLRRRIEELRKHRNESTIRREDALSKKKLLKDDANIEEYDHSSQEDEINHHKVLPKENNNNSNNNNAVRAQKLSKVVPLPVSGYGIMEEQHNKHAQERVVMKNNVESKPRDEFPCSWPQHDDVTKHHDDLDSDDNNDKDDDDDDEEDDDEDDDDENGRLLGPGSPSFRIYIEPVVIIKEKERENQTNVIHRKSPSDDSCESAPSEHSGNSNEAVEIIDPTPKRKGHNKMKKLGAVKKNLLSVKNLQVKHKKWLFLAANKITSLTKSIRSTQGQSIYNSYTYR
ncbi:hypothetical protein RIF29_10636 [Crotalaria pallida]|uniref:Uncharacterized protein n=1 Tax=Crotalaria pallida TaxID=3830 RepID=A0AAN9IJY8_CROPI